MSHGRLLPPSEHLEAGETIGMSRSRSGRGHRHPDHLAVMEVARYEIAVRGHLGSALSVMFEGMEVRSSGPNETSLVGEFQDQAALQGFLAQVGDLGLELSAVRRLSSDEAAQLSIYDETDTA